MIKYLVSYFLFLQLKFSLNLEIDEDNISNCNKYAECVDKQNCEFGEKECEECEDKYFPFYNGLLCLPCDESIYGNIGCGGKCDGSNYVNTRNIICEEGGCKEGFYNLGGICLPCYNSSDKNCAKCSYSSKNDFKCLEFFITTIRTMFHLTFHTFSIF